MEAEQLAKKRTQVKYSKKPTRKKVDQRSGVTSTMSQKLGRRVKSRTPLSLKQNHKMQCF